MIAKNTDLTKISTGAKLTRAERVDAELRHLAAMNHAKLRAAQADHQRRGISPRVAIGCAHIPAAVAQTFAYIKVA
ncbi:hypothetical protein [Cupriavidus sp. BIC8F]|uniref:hypothetical protein n=1 Tax=Cupriavidus sp. BIC8F TaxID=3079014 RepID=UPI0029164896|nr:hypothetical protein [Cupriavidus sp. BIC8F]